MFNSRSDVICTHKKFTWTDFGVYIPGVYIYTPRRYTPLLLTILQPGSPESPNQFINVN